MNAFVHTPALLSETTALLAPRPGGVYVDATVGQGGHAEEILRVGGQSTQLFGIDRDESALAASRQRLAAWGSAVTLIRGRFGDLAQLLAARAAPAADGILADLGVSSPQLDQAARGFSFAREGPLDMRMDGEGGITAAQLILRSSTHELQRILKEYGEEKYAAKIARALKASSDQNELSTTRQLAELVTRVVPSARAPGKIHPATRTFQALRIAVNGELDQLDRLLYTFVPLLRVGGRLVVISYHSLEDRRVKQRFRDLAWTSRLPADLARQAGERTAPVCVPITKKPIVPSEAELARNPRARSAKLRACEKTSEEKTW